MSYDPQQRTEHTPMPLASVQPRASLGSGQQLSHRVRPPARQRRCGGGRTAFPVDAAAILEGIRKGQIDLSLNVRGLDRSVNRLACAVLAAALFSGSARLWTRKVAPLVGSVSVSGAVGTLTVGACAVRFLRASKRAGGIG